jgi:hypothetical protein
MAQSQLVVFQLVKVESKLQIISQSQTYSFELKSIKGLYLLVFIGSVNVVCVQLSFVTHIESKV